jgi:predicted SnoaL-like aldol condensation-catalyzing enzyme
MEELVARPSTKEHTKGKPLKNDGKKNVIKAFEKFSEKYPLLKIKKMANMTSELTGVSTILLKRLAVSKYRILS